jgi:hypothetical protein
MEVQRIRTYLNHTPLVLGLRVYPNTFVPSVTRLALSWKRGGAQPAFSLELAGTARTSYLACNATEAELAAALSELSGAGVVVEARCNTSLASSGRVW